MGEKNNCMDISSDKRNLTREDSDMTESLLIVAQDNSIKTNYIKTKIDKTQEDSKYKLCGIKDETINHMISKCSKLAQRKYKTKHNWAEKVIHKEFSKKSKFDQTNKYMHKLESILKNDTYKILWDFDIPTYHLLLVIKPG